jgi:hypothetical protein
MKHLLRSLLLLCATIIIGILLVDLEKKTREGKRGT